MNGYVTKNYGDQNGDRWVIGGELAIQTPGKITLDGVEIKRMPDQPNSTAADVATLVNDFNALLAKLKAAGLMS